VRKSFKLLVVLMALPLATSAELAETFQTESGRSTGIASNVAIDIIAHGVDSTGVWMATGKGINYSYDDGASWFVYNTAHGLPSENLSAIFSIGGRIWIGSNHDEFIQDRLMTLSDGLTYSDDDGETWTTLDFGPNGLNIPFVEGGDRTIFDITGHYDLGFFNHQLDDTTDWLFFAAFAGGLLASQDGGENWRRIFPSRIDSIQFNLTSEAPSLRNRYFSCVADTSHGDSLFLWAGTAAGIFQYVYAPASDKLYSHWINQVAFCDTCSSNGGSRIFVGGESGLTLGSAAGGQLVTRFEIDGLPGPEVSAVHSIGDNLIVGTIDPVSSASTGLAISTDQGESFTAVTLPEVVGGDRSIADFTQVGSRVYLAAQTAGLFVSEDSGTVWQQVPLDTLYPEATLNTVYSLNVMADTLLVGTDSGLVELRLDINGDILSSVHHPFVDDDSSSARIIRIKPQWFENDTLPGTYDSTVLWTIHRPLDVGGVPMVGRRSSSGAWRHLRKGVEIYDVNFFGDTTFVVGEQSIWFTPSGEDPTNFFSARQYVDDTLVVASLDNDTVTVMEVRQDTVIFGSSNGIAISHDRGDTFTIYRANSDTLAADLVINHSYLASYFGLAGDFIPALGVQYPYMADGPARIWAGARPAGLGGQGISVGVFDTASGSLAWQTVYTDDFAWNFEFMGDTVFAATSSGLLMNHGQLDSLNTVWEKVDLVDQTSGEVLVTPGTSVYGVELVDPFLWVGTDDGTVRLSRSDLSDQTLYLRVDSTTAADEVYAFPVPFSPNLGQTVDFHFVVQEAGSVTVEVYDFAMNLVARPVDKVYYQAGIYPAQGVQGITWDGLNERGDLVAVGIYYFKVEFQSGETRWGKLAVIP